MKFVFHPAAEVELMQVIEYYEECREGLGNDFFIEVYAAIDRILLFPFAWTVLAEDIRRCLLHRFPYGIIYSNNNELVEILAVMNLHRNPDYWNNRKTINR